MTSSRGRGSRAMPSIGSAALDSALRAARAGAEWAWEPLYREAAPMVLGYLKGKGVEDPEDVLEEVFVAAVKGIASLEGDFRAFRTWLLTIAHHRVVDDYRRRSRRREDLIGDDVLVSAGGLGDAEQEALARLGAAQLLQSVGRLPRSQQDVLLLRVVADLSVAEVAAVLGKSAGAVKALQRRALAGLRRQISRQGAPV